VTLRADSYLKCRRYQERLVGTSELKKKNNNKYNLLFWKAIPNFNPITLSTLPNNI
jgi:hypothetical protein